MGSFPIKNLLDTLSTRLNFLMRQASIDVVNLSKATGIPVTTINRLRNEMVEHNPTLDTLTPLANYFSVTISQLIGEEPLDNYSHNKITTPSVQSFPVLSWDECIDYTNFVVNLNVNNWDKRVIGEFLSKYAFALLTKPSMEPRFSKGTIVIINPEITPKDGNIVVVHYPNTKEATLRQYSLDGPSTFLKSINEIKPNNNNLDDNLDEKIKIIGIVSRTMYSFE